MVAIRIPTPKPETIFPIPPGSTSLRVAVDALSEFIYKNHRPVVLTGAGISVDSGIPDYRGPNGVYTRNTNFRPTFYHEFCNQHSLRQRYWARSFVGWLVVGDAKPNSAHLSIEKLYKAGYLSSVVTQNVDSLHQNVPLTNLHGSLATASCLTCGYTLSRRQVQNSLIALNPIWVELSKAASQQDADQTKSQLNPDGDIDLKDARYDLFRYPVCPECQKNARVETSSDGAWLQGGGILKPDVVFFGETVNPLVRRRAVESFTQANSMLILGTSLATLSAFSLVKDSKRAGKPTAIINLGSVRSESELINPQTDIRLVHPVSNVLTGVCRELIPADDSSLHDAQ